MNQSHQGWHATPRQYSEQPSHSDVKLVNNYEFISFKMYVSTSMYKAYRSVGIISNDE